MTAGQDAAAGRKGTIGGRHETPLRMADGVRSTRSAGFSGRLAALATVDARPPPAHGEKRPVPSPSVPVDSPWTTCSEHPRPASGTGAPADVSDGERLPSIPPAGIPDL